VNNAVAPDFHVVDIRYEYGIAVDRHGRRIYGPMDKVPTKPLEAHAADMFKILNQINQQGIEINFYEEEVDPQHHIGYEIRLDPAHWREHELAEFANCCRVYVNSVNHGLAPAAFDDMFSDDPELLEFMISIIRSFLEKKGGQNISRSMIISLSWKHDLRMIFAKQYCEKPPIDRKPPHIHSINAVVDDLCRTGSICGLRDPSGKLYTVKYNYHIHGTALLEKLWDGEIYIFQLRTEQDAKNRSVYILNSISEKPNPFCLTG